MDHGAGSEMVDDIDLSSRITSGGGGGVKEPQPDAASRRCRRGRDRRLGRFVGGCWGGSKNGSKNGSNGER